MNFLTLLLAASIGMCSTTAHRQKYKTRTKVVRVTDQKVIDRAIVKTLRSEP